jgi:hypothetical protein
VSASAQRVTIVRVVPKDKTVVGVSHSVASK